MLPVPVKSSVNWRNKHAFNRCSCKDLKGNSSQLYLLNEHGDPYFLLQISDHYIVGNNQGKFKKKLCQLLFLWNHLKPFHECRVDWLTILEFDLNAYFLLTVRIFIFIFMRIVLFIYCTVLRIVLFKTENSWFSHDVIKIQKSKIYILRSCF